ncbi:MAG: hypothetical protein ACSW8G_01860 [Bacillota bacterium]
MSNSKITVTIPRGLSRELFLLCVVILMIPVAFTLFQNERNPAMYVCFALLVIPFLFGGFWAKNYRIVVKDDRFTVRRWNGTQYSFDVSEIEKVTRKINDSGMGTIDAFVIRTGRRKISVDNLMMGSEKMGAYLLEHVPEDRIEVVERSRHSSPGKSS